MIKSQTYRVDFTFLKICLFLPCNMKGFYILCIYLNFEHCICLFAALQMKLFYMLVRTGEFLTKEIWLDYALMMQKIQD